MLKAAILYFHVSMPFAFSNVFVKVLFFLYQLVELQDYVNKLQVLNAELQRSASLTASSAHNPAVKDKEDVTKLASQEVPLPDILLKIL